MEPTAKNVPKIRTDLLRRVELARRNWSQYPLERYINYSEEARRDVLSTEAHGLFKATNLWVAPEWVKHLDTIRAKLDPSELVLHEEGLFATAGFVVFPEPVIIPAVDLDAPLPVSALMWVPEEVESEHGFRSALTISSYVYRDHYRLNPPTDLPMDGAEDLSPAEIKVLWNVILDESFKGSLWQGTGRNDWFFDTAADDMTDSMTVLSSDDPEMAANHIAIDRTLFWTLNKLLTAERHTERSVRQPSQNKSKKRRKDISGDDGVTIIHLRKDAPKRPVLNPGTGKKLDHESKTVGHWRNQKYGPGRSLTKRIWVSEYKRGEGLPPKEQVYSLDR